MRNTMGAPLKTDSSSQRFTTSTAQGRAQRGVKAEATQGSGDEKENEGKEKRHRARPNDHKPPAAALVGKTQPPTRVPTE